MHRLLNTETLNKIVKNRVINKLNYEVIFEYGDIPITDSYGTETAHELIVGFRCMETKKVYTNSLYLPIVTEDGALQKNKIMWYPVSMVLPPIRFIDTNKRRFNLVELINNNRFAKSIHDFFPLIYGSDSYRDSITLSELKTDQPVELSNLYNWNVIELHTAIVEVFNTKIREDMLRSQSGGYQGVTTSIKAIYILINAFIRYDTADTSLHSGIDMSMTLSVEDNITYLNSISREDKKNSVVLHPIVSSIKLPSSSPIDFCSCNTSSPITTGRIKDGIKVIDSKFVGVPSFPYATWRRGIVGIKSDDPRRVIVSKAINRALILDDPDIPYAITEHIIDVDSISLPGISMTHPLTYEDSMIVSKTFARKMGAFKIHTDILTVPSSTTVYIDKVKYPFNDAKTAIKRMHNKSRRHSTGNFIMNKYDDAFTISYIDIEGEMKYDTIKSSISVRGLVTEVDTFIPVTELEDTLVTYKIKSICYYPLEYGDKLADAHGNKSTVGYIMNDEDMPTWTAPEGYTMGIHYITSPYRMKRLAVGAEIEDKLALTNKVLRDIKSEEYIIDSAETYSISDANEWLTDIGVSYTGEVKYNQETYEGVPVLLRRMFRLDNNVREVVKTKDKIISDAFGRKSRNTKISMDMISMYVRSATNILSDTTTQSNSRVITENTIMPVFYAISGVIPENAKTFEITEKIDKSILGKAYSDEILSKYDFEDTVCDPRLLEGYYGILTIDKDNIAIIPPHRILISTGNSSSVLSRICIAANRLLAEVESRNKGYIKTTNVDAQVTRYIHILVHMLSGKAGLLRNTIFQVFPVTIRSVATSYHSDDPLTIMLPKYEFNKILRSDPALQDIYKDRENWRCIIKRDPVHRTNNVISLKFKLWNHPSIGISPLIIKGLDGDFDGDTIIAMLANTDLMMKDIKKLEPNMSEIVVASKQISDCSTDEALYAIGNRIGWSSTFDKPHVTDEIKNPDLYTKLVNGISDKELNLECVRAIYDFDRIKSGTALVGSAAIAFIYSRRYDDIESIDNAMNLYHYMAQSTLDAKSGVDSQAAIHIASAILNGDNKKYNIERLLDTLGYTNPKILSELNAFIERIKVHGSMNRFLEKEHPLISCIISKDIPSVVDLSRKVIGNEFYGDTIIDKMFKYILPRSVNTDYKTENLYITEHFLSEETEEDKEAQNEIDSEYAF